jgi:alkylated DNA repair dioxygenase AlkB
MSNLPSFSNDKVTSTSMVSDTTILGSGDVSIHKNFLGQEDATKLFNELINNIDFQQWYHMPDKSKATSEPRPLKRIKRILVTPNHDNIVPYYRFTVNDQAGHGMITTYPPFLKQVCEKINNLLDTQFNHIVILLYRDGNDSIGFHKDKTLDLDENSPIVSLSLGHTRKYCLRDNIFNPKINQEIDLENDTLLVLGPRTNENFYHSIMPIESNKNNTCAPRISITLRKAVTFKLPDNTLIGKGAKYQTLNWPEELNGNHIIGYAETENKME